VDNPIFNIVIFYPLLLFCLSFHEAAHAWTADKFGDDTAKLLGRITLNPLPHMDLIGTVFLPLMSLVTGAALIGWGKPVPVNPYHFKDPRWSSLWVAAAGPISNLILAVLFALSLHGLLRALPYVDIDHLQDGKLMADAISLLFLICKMGVILNLALAFFNLIPFFPLDGGTVLRGLLPPSMVPGYDQFARYSPFLLLFLFISGLLRYVLIPVTLAAQFLLP